jgi:hypothetical protein
MGRKVYDVRIKLKSQIFTPKARKTMCAMMKYTKRPPTSTRVVMAGADITAGSPPKAATKKGKPAPIVDAMTYNRQRRKK